MTRDEFWKLVCAFGDARHQVGIESDPTDRVRCHLEASKLIARIMAEFDRLEAIEAGVNGEPRKG